LKLYPILFLIIYSFSPCSGQTKGDTSKFKRDVPKEKEGFPENLTRIYDTRQKVKKMKLDNLENGYDSLQIRIWYDYELKIEKNMLIIKCQNGVWSAISYIYEDRGDTIAKFRKEHLSPKAGWNSFINELYALKIATLPDMHQIPGMEGGLDGITYNIEYATKYQYRYYGYWGPAEFQDKYWQAKNMVKILNLIEKEFGIKMEYLKDGNK
jgi:hypothetical protein